MTAFRLITTADRVLEVESGQPITALARDEMIERIQRPDSDGPISEEDRAWIGSHVAPLIKPWGT